MSLQEDLNEIEPEDLLDAETRKRKKLFSQTWNSKRIALVENVCSNDSMNPLSRQNQDDVLDLEEEENITEVVESMREMEQGNEELEENMDIEASTEEHNQSHKSRRKRVGKYQTSFSLMLSKYMFEQVSDLEDNWLVKFCPTGRRTLVIAKSGVTRCYVKSGKHSFMEFKSFLPGGGGLDTVSKKCCTVLDCIYSRDTGVFFVLDLLVLGQLRVALLDVETRCFMVESNLTTYPLISQCGQYRFQVLRAMPSIKSQIWEHLMDTFNVEGREELYDGLLFYKKGVSYLQGMTNKALWLRSFMVQDVLGIPLPDKYREVVPEGYVNVRQYATEEKACRRLRRPQLDEIMEQDLESQRQTPSPRSRKL